MTRIDLLASTALLAVAVSFAPAVAAPKKTTTEAALPEVVVTADKPAVQKREPALATPLGAFSLTGEPLAVAAAATGDAAAMAAVLPGVQTATGGGVSSLPVLRGQADDRVNVLTMGMAITSACGNHMNPPMSYVDPSSIGRVEVLSGVTPVSKGGDSTGGTIIVEKKPPQFSTTDALAVHGAVSAFGRTNGNGVGGSVAVSVANRDWSIEYTGSWSRADNYRAGGGTKVLSSGYEALDHIATLAKRTEIGTFTLAGGIQHIPRQGFPNVRMDMLSNKARFVNGRFEGEFGWGRLDVAAFWQRTEHYMNFLADKGGNMPMYTDGTDAGWSVKATVDLGRQDKLTIGNELRHTTLDDWWPPVAGMVPGMCCNTFKNIADGRRTRLGTFAEWEHVWSKEWTTLLGVRNDTVWMDAGAVAGYSTVNSGRNMMGVNTWVYYLRDSTAFNARSHDKVDVNFDFTAQARWKPNDIAEAEFGYARKTRSPNFYERYAWSTGAMASRMISWFGDANGYVGDIDLKPEVAHNLSATLLLHDAARKAWEVKVTPWFSYVENYIDADRVANPPINYGSFPLLRFANHDARLWGVEASAKYALWESAAWGRFDLSGRLAYTNGRNLDTADGLYRVMPLEGTVGLDHRLGGWTQHVELQMAAAKTDVSATRNELKTPGYALVNWRTGYEWGNVRIDVGVDNLFDQNYRLPLGGIDFTVNKKTGLIDALAGQGRSLWVGASAKF